MKALLAASAVGLRTVELAILVSLPGASDCGIRRTAANIANPADSRRAWQGSSLRRPVLDEGSAQTYKQAGFGRPYQPRQSLTCS